MADSVLTFERVTLQIDGRTYLRDVNLEVREGESVVVAGLPGCGMSFVLRLALGLPGMDGSDISLGGRVYVLGKEIFQLGGTQLQRLRRRIGSVMRDGSLIENMDIHHNVTLPLQYHFRDSMSWSEIEARCDALLDDMELSDLGRPGIRPVALNREQRLYASLARALIVQPFLLLLDTPAAGLSPRRAQRMCRFAFRYEPEFATPLPGEAPCRVPTRVVTTSDLGSYLKFADRILVFTADGDILDAGDAVSAQASSDSRVRELIDCEDCNEAELAADGSNINAGGEHG